MTILAALVVLVLALVVGSSGGPLRVAAALTMAGVILAAGLRQIRRFGAVPPEPEVADVSEYGLRYVCSVCGLELKIEVVATDKAPTHCGEKMLLERTGGKPPLRPV